MTPLGTMIFGALGLLFVSFVGGMIWLAVREDDAIAKSLQAEGFQIDRSPEGWTASRKTTTITVARSGVKQRSVWTRVRAATNTAAADVLVTAKVPSLLAVDGALAAMVGFEPPPRWKEAPPELTAVCDVYASDGNAGAHWLNAERRSAILEFYRDHRPVALRFFQDAIEARWAKAPSEAAELAAVVALVERLR